MKNKTLVWIVFVVVAVLVIWGARTYDPDFSKFAPDESPSSVAAHQDDDVEILTQTLREGTGEAAKTGDTLVVHYRGTLGDGTQFDASYDRGEPFEVTLGEGAVIPGWEYGLTDMKVGEKRKLVIPPELAYGEGGRTLPDGTVVIPPNATLTFEVELLEIK